MGIVAQISLQMIGVAVIGAVGTIFASLFAAIIAAGVAKNIRADVFEKVEGFSFAEFNKFSTASFVITSYSIHYTKLYDKRCTQKRLRIR